MRRNVITIRRSGRTIRQGYNYNTSRYDFSKDPQKISFFSGLTTKRVFLKQGKMYIKQCNDYSNNFRTEVQFVTLKGSDQLVAMEGWRDSAYIVPISCSEPFSRGGRYNSTITKSPF